MDIFGPRWHGHAARLKEHWHACIQKDDLVLIPGDISWAKTLTAALVDLEWIHQLPGTKVLLRGNHDYWWGSLASIRKVLPPSLILIQNDAFNWHQVTIGGARLWDTPEYSFADFIPMEPTPIEAKQTPSEAEGDAEKIFQRELGRLDLSLRALDPSAALRIALTHYPPIGAQLAPSRASVILEKFRIDICVFGHLHSVIPHSLPFGKRQGVDYHLVACDYLDCVPLKIKEI